MPSFKTVLVFVLGVFEFITVLDLFTSDNTALVEKYRLFPPQFITDHATKTLVAVFALFLAFLRLGWVFSGRTLGSWLCLVLSHLVEMAFIWNLALMPHFNTNGLDIFQLLTNVVHMKYDRFSTILLLAVQLMPLTFLVTGPEIPVRKSSKTKKSK